MVNCRQNNCNRDSNKNTSSIYKGVCFDKRTKKWRTQIKINKKTIFLGYYNTELNT